MEIYTVAFFKNNIHIQYMSFYQIPKICHLKAAPTMCAINLVTLRDQFQDILETPVQLTDG